LIGSGGVKRRVAPAAGGYVIVAVVAIFALAAPLVASYSPITADPSVYLLPPSFSHLFGGGPLPLQLMPEAEHRECARGTLT
jgi:hypothetical protein